MSVASLETMTLPAALPGAPTPAKKRADLIPAAWQAAVIVPAALIAVMVVVQLVATFGVNMASLAGIQPRTASGLVGIPAPFVHGSWAHLLSNAVPFLIFGFLVMVHGAKQFLAVTVVVWLVAGLGVWLTAPSNSVVIGASGIVFGWLTYLLARGIFNRNIWQILVGVVLFVIWGGMFWGVLPGAPGISWQGHLFGSIGGVLAAFLAAKADGGSRRARKPVAAPSSAFTLPS